MKRRVVHCCALLVALAGCGRADRAADRTAVAAAAPRKLRVMFLPHVSWAPLMIAEAE